MDNDLRGVERAFETALRRIETGDSDEILIPRDMVKSARVVRETYVMEDPPTETLEAVGDALELATTVTSVLGVCKVSDVDSDEADVIRELYRFVTGPIREALSRADESTDNPPDTALLSRITDRRLTIEEKLVYCGTISDNRQRTEA